MKIVYLLFATLLLSGCQQNSLKQQLVQIDSIANLEGDQKALEALDNIVPEAINEEECLAYYWLLKMRTEIRLQKEINSTEPLDISIKYYSNHHNKDKLAKAYIYKAYILDDKGDLRESIINLKEAESLIKKGKKGAAIAYDVYSQLSHVNYKAKELQLSIEYGKKALQVAFQQDNPRRIAYSLMSLYVAYNELNNDSAFYYIDKCIPLVDRLQENEKWGFYANIGNAYIASDTKLAEDFLNKSIDISPNAYAYKGLAHTYYKKGERERAQELWQQALQTDNLYLKAEILHALYESQRDEGDYKTASETAIQLATLKDSIANRQRKEDIRGQQFLFEQELDAEIERHRLIMYLALVGMLLCGTTALVAYLHIRRLNVQEELQKAHERLAQYHRRIEELQKEGKGDSKEVERLTKKISDLQAKQGALLQNGRERYEEVMAGGTTVRWSRNDFMDCIEYYRTQDAAFVAHMESDYRHLSAKYIFFALMEHLGKTDEELQHLMAISQSTIRSYRSRINSAAINPQQQAEQQ